MKYYQDQQGNYITVSEGSIKKTYAFYRVDCNKPSHRGSRVKTRPMLFYPSMEEGFTALHDYAEKRHWNFIGTDLPAAEVHQSRPQRYTESPLFTWLKHQDSNFGKPKIIKDSEYELFKTELVRRAILVTQNEMKDWKRPDPLRAIQHAMITLQQSGRWSSAIFIGLRKRILNDTGKKIDSIYQIKNMMGGVYARAVCHLEDIL